MKFPCTQCGQCCRNISGVPGSIALDRGDGVCKHLVGKHCGVYANRPVICNVDAIFNLNFKSIMTKKQFYTLNLNYCKKIQQYNEGRL
jgi:Fe-S-cluster containining protein